MSSNEVEWKKTIFREADETLRNEKDQGKARNVNMTIWMKLL